MFQIYNPVHCSAPSNTEVTCNVSQLYINEVRLKCLLRNLHRGKVRTKKNKCESGISVILVTRSNVHSSNQKTCIYIQDSMTFIQRLVQYSALLNLFYLCALFGMNLKFINTNKFPLFLALTDYCHPCHNRRRSSLRQIYLPQMTELSFEKMANAADELSKYSNRLICTNRGREQIQHIEKNCRSIHTTVQLCSQAVPS